MDKQVLVDVDGCILDWLTAFLHFMEEQGYTPTADKPNQYALEEHFNTTYEDINNRIIEFNSGNWIFGTLKPLEGVVNVFKELKERGVTFVAITSCSKNNLTVALRKANLYTVFGDVFDEVHCLELHESKSDYLKLYKPTVWIEDKFSTCVEGLEFNHKCLLLDQSWNKNDSHDDIQRCANWFQIGNIIKEHFGIDEKVVL